jgi:hypothetical protein
MTKQEIGNEIYDENEDFLFLCSTVIYKKYFL